MEFSRALVAGLGIAGEEVARCLLAHGVDVVAVDDAIDERIRGRAAALGTDLVDDIGPDRIDALLDTVDAVFPSPGLPEAHPITMAARASGVRVLSEFDLARMLDTRPIVAITGTDGKTTVTTLVTRMLEASGVRAIACGNTETPLVAAIGDPRWQVMVVEASSFRLATTERFEPMVAVWLNFAPDHLDAHVSLASYEAAKARIWRDMDVDSGLAVANVDDPVVMANLDPRLRTVTFGGEGSGADATVRDGMLVLPDGTSLLAVAEMSRRFPHDVDNALAASVAAMAAGADPEGIREVLRSFTGLAHRISFVAERDGIRWYDDSKATTPHAALTAVGAFDSVVLLAGGRNKGLDLSVLASAVPPIRAVVAIGEASAEVAEAFAGRCPVAQVETGLDDAVRRARELAEAGDAVVLSPGCTSFDWFESYAQRGDEFARSVNRLLDESGSRR